MTVPGPLTDDDVPAFWQALGLPGLADVHVHFMPERVLAKVWSYFDAAGPKLGRPWPITYREDEVTRLDRLRDLGVVAFPSLVYAHKPGMAAWLNDWSLEFAERTPGVVPTATMHPEPEAAAYVASALERGARMFKVHVQVGDYDPRDPLLDRAWGLLAEAGVPVIAHTAGGPVPGRFTGPGPFGEVLARHPQLHAVIAHLGLPEVSAFADLVERYDHVMFDTTMAWTDFWPGEVDLDPVRARDLGLAGRIALGTDFPNIPHPYAHQLEALARLDLGDDWLRAVCWDTPARVLGLDPG